MKKNGITLITLIITIIVLLILAGISISIITGENGILNQATTSTLSTRVAKYKEEMEMNIIGKTADKYGIPVKEKVTLLNEYVKDYIPSLIESDIGKFGIISGELYYLGENELEKDVCISQNIKVKKESQTMEEILVDAESGILQKIESQTVAEIGEILKSKEVYTSNWHVVRKITTDATELNAPYGTGWTLLRKGSTVNGIGKLTSDYIIKFGENGNELISINDREYVELKSGENKAVRQDNLVIDIDSSNMTDNLQDSWGENVTLHGFTYGDTNSGYIDGRIKLDGVDDEITFNAGSNFEEGFTLEFYGKYLGGSMPYFAKQKEDNIVKSARFSLETYRNFF